MFLYPVILLVFDDPEAVIFCNVLYIDFHGEGLASLPLPFSQGAAENKKVVLNKGSWFPCVSWENNCS